MGAAGYLLKDTPRDDLVKRAAGNAGGQGLYRPWWGSKLLGQLTPPRSQLMAALASKLSEREFEIIQLIARGLSNSA